MPDTASSWAAPRPAAPTNTQSKPSAAGDERKLVKGRPAFHYRLPDCKINVPGWTAAAPWNRWVYIEKLAANDALLLELIGAWRECNDKFSLVPKTSWVVRLTSLLSQKFFER